MPVLLQSGGGTAVEALLPERYGVIWALSIGAIVLLSIAAVVRIARSHELAPTSRAVWVSLVLLTPPLGAVAALLLVRRTKTQSVVRSS